ncbi:MAG: hypothetical protein IJ604_12015 [Prevotella sp.]|nr:hypothetical protein [Prevotella sp.]
MENTELLCKAVEAAIGHKMRVPKDFEELRERIYARLRLLISPTTLKRVWQYLPNDNIPGQRTLDTLARFIGYSDYESFCQHASNPDVIVSSPVISRHINVLEDLIENDQLTLSWQPDRLCNVRYLGNLQFRVIDSQNTRLLKGDYFQCGLIIEGEPLYLSRLLHGDNPPANYVCGKKGGVRFEINQSQ